MLKKIKLNKKGFTLAELLIVIAVIAVLVAIAIPAFSGALDGAQKAADDANIRAAFAQYQVDRLTKPNDTTEITGNNAATPDAAAWTYYTSLKYPELKFYKGIDVDSNPWGGTADAAS